MSTETIRLIGRRRGRGYGGEGRGRSYTNCYTVTTGMTPAWRWAAVRAILMFHNCEGQSHKTVSTDHNFWRERTAKADSNRGPSAYQPSTLPLGQTDSRGFVDSGLGERLLVILKQNAKQLPGKKMAKQHLKNLPWIRLCRNTVTPVKTPWLH